MAKNFAALYASQNPSTGLSQKIFIKQETTRGVMVAPAGADFIWTQEGTSSTITQGSSPSPHKSGRHNDSTIWDKITGEWTIPAFFNIDPNAAQGVTELDPATRVLWKSAFGKEATATGVVYTAEEDPSITFTIFENGDKFANQIFGAAVDGSDMEFPGDGQAKVTWSGRCKNGYLVGIGKSVVDNDAGNIVTLATITEAKRFPVGAMVMIVEADGVTRSADTVIPRVVTASDALTGAVTLSGAVLADADGSGLNAPIYLAYWEPLAASIVAINNPMTGLVGSIAIDNLPGGLCFRSASLSHKNNHEWEDYCYGKDTLGDDIFIPGQRVTDELTIGTNFRQSMIEYFNDKKEHETDAVTIILGDAAGRHLKIEMPKVQFTPPSVTIPANGALQVELKGTCLETALDAGDEVKLSYL